ncbi:MAG: DUF1926 domain-containing protein [Chitinispirillales bacterium]|jgi:hypothetical protein|nr:DUF1926 domain-containing protein [Chitinispirillales bacterium]
MRRNRIILLLQPYKNRLMPQKELAASVNRFMGALLAVCAAYPRLRFNVALPGYMLEHTDKRLIVELADTVKRGAVECLCMGYTEPFLSFSPLWLTSENIALGVRVFSELTSEAPGGFVPPFSNWEPSYIDMLYGAGFKYAVVSSELLAEGSDRRGAGYWITESTGNSMAVFPVRSYHLRNAPQDLAEWVRGELPEEGPDDAPRILILKYMYSLEFSGPDMGVEAPAGADGGRGGRRRKRRDDGEGPGAGDPQRSWLERTAAEIDKRILELQPMRFRDIVGDAAPLGLHYFPSGLVPPNNGPVTPYFLNYLHCYDQISVMQRKLMDVGDSVAALKDARTAARLKRTLFFAQDINRFLPNTGSGFVFIPDRLWTYGRLIDIENELYGRRETSGGMIRLSEFLRNGYKSAVLANRALKLYIDHKNGGQVYELDYLGRSFNACAAYNPAIRQSPEVVDPRESRLAFGDKVFLGLPTYENYKNGAIADCGNFACLPMEYTFKCSPGSVRILLNAVGGFTREGRRNPLTIDKVFSLEKDGAVLSYSYKLGNPTPANYAFTFAIEIPLSLPGVPRQQAELRANKQKLDINTDAPITVDDVTEWEINDEEAGVRLEFVTQKKVTIWLFTQDAIPETVSPKKAASTKSSMAAPSKGAYGTTLMITNQTEIEPNSTQLFTGRICFKKIRMRSGIEDAA